MATAAAARYPEIPGYQIQSVLGRGGMGRVYLAVDTRLQRSVAIKTLVDAFDDELIRRFEAEVRAAAILDHPNIAKIYDFVRTRDGVPACVMEWLSGGSLAERIRERPPSFGEAATIVETLARAMHSSHEAGIVHRDLKPGNVLLAAHNPETIQPRDLRIVDFGLAKSTRTADAGLTQTGQVLGTPAYMAPEQASGLVQRIGPAADVYALGGILYEMLVGKPPFLSNDPVQTLMMVLSTDPVLPRELNRHVPRDLQTICLKCLEKKASRRYASALALADDLRNWLENRPIQSRPVGWYVRVGKWIRRNPWQTAAAILLTTLAISSLVATWSLDAAYRETQHANQLLGESNRDLEQANHQANQAFELSRTTLDKVITELGYRLEDLPQAEALFESTQRDTANMYQRLLQLRPDDPLVLRATIMSLENVRTLDWLRGDQAAEVERARQSHELVQRGRSLFPLDDWFAARELQMDIDQFQSLPAADPNRAAREAELLDRLQALETAFPDSASVALANYDWQDALFAAAAAAGNLAEARQALSKRVNWARRHLDLDSTRDPSAPLRLVQALYTAASIELATGEDSQCQKSLREAQQILDEVEPQFRNREHRRLLADIQRLQGSAASRGLDPTSAITCFRSAIGWLEPLVADFPGELSYQVNLAQTRFELASVLMATGQLPLAVQELESARAVTSRVLEAQPEHFAALSLRQQLERAFATLPEAHQ